GMVVVVGNVTRIRDLGTAVEPVPAVARQIGACLDVDVIRPRRGPVVTLAVAGVELPGGAKTLGQDAWGEHLARDRRAIDGLAADLDRLEESADREAERDRRLVANRIEHAFDRRAGQAHDRGERVRPLERHARTVAGAEWHVWA